MSTAPALTAATRRAHRAAMLSRLFSWKVILLALAALAVGVGGLLWLRAHDYNVRATFDDGVTLLRRAGPVPFFCALALLPAVGFPIFVFYVVAGTAFTATMGLGNVLAATGAAVAANLALTYWLARFGLRPWLEGLIAQTRFKIPALDAADHAELTLILRLTPGPPFFLQSYLLGLAGVRFGTYLWISWAIAMAYATGVIVFGDAILHGQAKLAVLGVSALVAVSLIAHFLRRHYGKKRT